MIFTVSLREPFRSALRAGRAADVADAEALTEWDLFGRGLARTAVGRVEDARADFERSRAIVGDPARLEVAFLDLRRPGAAAEVAGIAREVATAARQPSLLAARATHIAGLAEERLGDPEAAVESLLEAARRYRDAGDELGRLHVLDSLGRIQAARGRLEDAVHHFALSIAGKALLGDREGLAISLGSMGRTHLQAGRYDQALDCLDADLRIAREIGDRRGTAQVLADIGRVYQAKGEGEPAEQSLRSGLVIALEHGYRDIAFFARIDLVRLLASTDRTGEAGSLLNELRETIPPAAEEAYRTYLRHAEGVVAMASGSDAAEVLRDAADTFARLHRPDAEVATLIDLAKALLSDRRYSEAEACLDRGVGQARAYGLLRYVPELNDLLGRAAIARGLTGIAAGDTSVHESRFLVRGRLGAGAFGEVFRVYDSTLQREAALKVLRLPAVSDPRVRRRLIDSARAELAVGHRIRHPGLVQILETGLLADGRMFVLQQLVAGRPLSDRIGPQSRGTPRDVLPCLAEIAFALAELHAAGVVHRDLKPANVLLRDDGTPVLIDFGIAHFAGDGDVPPEVLGTLPYLSPEQACRRKLDGRSDLYALGVVAFEWLTGIRPLRPRGATFAETSKDIASRPPLRLAELRPDLPPELGDLLAALLAKKPRHRPASALEVADRLKHLSAAPH